MDFPRVLMWYEFEFRLLVLFFKHSIQGTRANQDRGLMCDVWVEENQEVKFFRL